MGFSAALYSRVGPTGRLVPVMLERIPHKMAPCCSLEKVLLTLADWPWASFGVFSRVCVSVEHVCKRLKPAVRAKIIAKPKTFECSSRLQ